jgi:hypothetical protein
MRAPISRAAPTSRETPMATRSSITDPHGLLEGSGKGRRHLKLRNAGDVGAKHLADYLALGLQAARNAS